VGESPDAAATLGVNPVKVKYAAVIASGVGAGLAGAQLALGNVIQFAENMSAGRGWIAVVAVLLGRAHPWGVGAAVALFGLSEAVGFRLQGNGMPSQLTDVLPFAMTLVALLFARKRFQALLDLSSSE
jgi:simple sugar transport system permease protein